MNRHENHRHRDPRQPQPPKKGGGGKRAFWIVLVVVIAGLSIRQFRMESTPQPPRPAKPLATLKKPQDLQEQVAEQGILGGAKAGTNALAAAKRNADRQVALVTEHDPTPLDMKVEKTDRGYRVLGARSEKFYSPRDEAEAKEDARRVAQKRLAEELGGLTPAVEEVAFRVEQPSADVVKLWKESGLDTDKVWVVVDVQTSEQAIRVERSKVRFHQIGFWVGAGFLVLLTGYGFLRLDMWTKGYLTTALGVIAVLLIGGGILAMTLARG